MAMIGQRTRERAVIDLRPEAQRAAPGVARALWADLRSPLSFVIVLRVFIGVGWTRAGLEKLASDTWLNGGGVADFISQQLGTGSVAVASAADIMRFLEPHAALVAWVVAIVEVVVGFFVLFGILTNGALVAGIVLNLVFMVAGAPNPSAFYVVMQLVLLMTGAGAVFGVDKWLAEDSRTSWLHARPRSAPTSLHQRLAFGAAGAAMLGAGGLLVRRADGLTVTDATAVLGFTLALLGVGAALVAVRGDGFTASDEAVGPR